jgi:hypothetical protein
VVCTIVDKLVQVHVAIANRDVETTLRVGADPGLLVGGGILATEAGKRDEVSPLQAWHFNSTLSMESPYRQAKIAPEMRGELYRSRDSPNRRSRPSSASCIFLAPLLSLTTFLGKAYTAWVGRLAQLVRASR